MSASLLEAPSSEVLPVDSGSNSRTDPAITAVILVVEDSGVQRQIITRSLKRKGLEVLQAANGTEAINLISTSPRIDLMILDYELPDMSGDQIVDALAKAEKLPPFVVSTARGNERVAVDMMKRGAIDYLIKDDTLIASLPAIVDRMLKQLKMDQIVSEVEEALHRSEHRLRVIIDSTVDAFVSMDCDGCVLEWNQAAETMFGWSRDQALGMDAIEHLVPVKRRGEIRRLLQQFQESPVNMATRIHQEAVVVNQAGRVFPVEISLSTIQTGDQWVINAFLQDISRRRELETQLVQSEKMASLGQLAAGVAHEINNPISYVRSNLCTLQEYFNVFSQLISHYEQAAQALAIGSPADALPAIAAADELRQKEKYNDIVSDIKELFDDSDEGLVRVKEIVQNLKSFARLDEAEVKEVDLNECLDTTLKVVANELKYKTTIHLDLGAIPRLSCYPGQLNQVFMNLLMNASQAISDRGDIFIRTWQDEESLYVSIRDTGMGIRPEHLPNLFTPFFTTKPVGSGTGLGLSISYGIVQKHYGDISVESELGQGTTFTIRLPKEGIPA